MRFAGMVVVMMALGVHNANAIDFSCTIGPTGEKQTVLFLTNVSTKHSTAKLSFANARGPINVDVSFNKRVLIVHGTGIAGEVTTAHQLTIMMGKSQPYNALYALHVAMGWGEDIPPSGLGTDRTGTCTTQS